MQTKLLPSQLLSQPGAWCQRYDAVDADDNQVKASSPKAVQWCIIGALSKCIDSSDDYGRAYATVQRALPGGVVDWNDAKGRTQSEVVALLQSVGL